MANISNAFTTLFDQEVKQAYQASRKLGGLIREKNAQGASTVKFPTLGKGIASVRTPMTDVVPMNLVFSSATATMTDFIAAEYSDIFNQSHVNFSERQELVQAVGKSIGRRMDQVTLDALTAAAGTGTVANSIGGANTDLNIEKLRETKRIMDAANVDPDGRTFLMHANSLEALLGETEVTSSDFASIKALVNGEVNSYMGFNFIMLGDMDEGGLAKDGNNDRTIFAFHKSALGMGTSMDQQSRVDYIPEKTSFLVASMFSAGAVAIEGAGIVKITCREA
tara:strand:- start:657 stop:1496 length:840 start_codon:yes stop_codon:yes gene_type:complete